MAKAVFFLLLTVFLVLLPFASAQIIISDFKEIYSVGDSIKADFSVIESQDVSGLIKLELNCGEKSLFYTSPISVKANNAQKFDINPYMLTQSGNCKVEITFKGDNFIDSAESKSFLVSQEINISLKLNKETFRPGETIKIKGEAQKANGGYIDGLIATINIGNEEYSSIIKKGAFEFETELKENFPSGESEITVETKDNAGNSGKTIKKISVTAIPTSLEITANNNSFAPESTLKASAILYDQGGEEIPAAISIILYDSWGIDVAKKVINGSQESLEYTFEQKSPTGEWWIYAYSEGIRVRRFISVEEKSGISANLTGSTLEILNTGNTEFKKPIEILFQNDETAETKIEELNLGIASQEAYHLTAPEGSYNIILKTDNFEKSFENVYLTGGVIGVRNPENQTLKIAKDVVALAVVIAIAATAIIIKLKRKKPVIVDKSYNPSTKKFAEKI
jgi:hypothetical protein